MSNTVSALIDKLCKLNGGSIAPQYAKKFHNLIPNYVLLWLKKNNPNLTKGLFIGQEIKDLEIFWTKEMFSKLKKYLERALGP